MHKNQPVSAHCRHISVTVNKRYLLAIKYVCKGSSWSHQRDANIGLHKQFYGSSSFSKCCNDNTRAIPLAPKLCCHDGNWQLINQPHIANTHCKHQPIAALLIVTGLAANQTAASNQNLLCQISFTAVKCSKMAWFQMLEFTTSVKMFK